MTVHFKARVRLVPATALESAWRHGDGVAGRLARPLPPDHRPEELPTLMEPQLIELCFQTAGAWPCPSRSIG